MSGDWLKIETALPEKPEVWQIAGMLQIDADAVVGKLLKVWRWFDIHTKDGNAVGVTYLLVDSVAGVTGFGEAMALAGWLVQDGALLSLPNFDRHNGKTAKTRALTGNRVKRLRNADDVTDALPEKRREEKRKKPPISPKGDRPAVVVAAFHANLPKCQRAEVINPKRLKRILAADRLAERVSSEQGWDYDPEGFWESYFQSCAKDPWMRGEVPNPKSSTWKQNLDVLIAEDRFASVMDSAISTLRQAQC